MKTKTYNFRFYRGYANPDTRKSYIEAEAKVIKCLEEYINTNGGIFGNNIALCYSTGTNTEEDTIRFADKCRQDNNLIAAMTNVKAKKFHELVKDLPFIVPESKEHEEDYFDNPTAFNLTKYDELSKFKILSELISDTNINSHVCVINNEKESIENIDHLYEIIEKRCKEDGRQLSRIELPKGTEDPTSYFKEKISLQEDNTLWILSCVSHNIKLINILQNLYDSPSVIITNGTFINRTEKYPQKMISCGARLYDLGELDFDNFIQRVVPYANAATKSSLITSSVRFDCIKILHFASTIGTDQELNTTSDICEALLRNMHLIDGRNYVYEGLNRSVYFNDRRRNVLTDNYVVEFISEKKGALQTPYQYSYDKQSASIAKSSTIYVFIDMLRVSNIDESNGIFSAEFFLDMNCNADIGIDDLRFDNICIENDDLKISALFEKSVKENTLTMYHKRYMVSATFKFDVDLENYPLDKQLISIDMAPVYSEGKPMQFQPMPKSMQDLEFDCPGWKIISGRIGKKSGFWKMPIDRHFNMSFIEKYNISFGWVLERQVNDTLLKICVPLGILVLISYFPVVSSKESSDTMMSVLITSLLAAIALYFSLEKPVSDKMTLLDKIFIVSYVIIGMYLVGLILTIPFSDYFYNTLMKVWMVLCPMLICIFGIKMFKIFKRKSIELI
jgi:hypothetical protein